MKSMTLVFALFLFFASAFPVFAAKPTDTGFNQYGYNNTARLFNGTGASWSQSKGLPSDYLGIYATDKLVMKWNAEWDRGNGENWSNPPYAAWEDNEWNGKFPGGSGQNWHYKIIWVGQQYNVTGSWKFNFEYQGSFYEHSASLAQSHSDVSGDGGYPAQGPYSYHWNIISGNVTGNQLHMVMVYDAGVPTCTMTMDGTISQNGTITNGTWSDDCWNQLRTGTWISTQGTAIKEVAMDGPYWRDGGYGIWDQFEVILDQGQDPNIGPGHLWYAHALPNGLGNSLH